MVRVAAARAIGCLAGALLAAAGAAPAARADSISFVAHLAATNEVPPVVVDPSELGATGTAFVTLDFTRVNGVVVSARAAFDVHVMGLTPASVVILAHVHQGGPTVNGPIRIDSGISPGMPIPVQPDGSVSFVRQDLAVSPVIAEALLADPAAFYFNVHTALSPGGVGRGQLGVEKGVPLLSVSALLVLGALLVAFGYRAVRRRAAERRSLVVGRRSSVHPAPPATKD